MWQVYVFNLVAALLIAGWYLHAVRRLERRMDDRMRKFDEWAGSEDAKFATAREEIKASLRARADTAIARLKARAADPQPSSNGHPDHGVAADSSAIEPAPH